jgi:hypothetical protein
VVAEVLGKARLVVVELVAEVQVLWVMLQIQLLQEQPMVQVAAEMAVKLEMAVLAMLVLL